MNASTGSAAHQAPTFMRTISNVYKTLTGRYPRLFEQETAKTMERAYEAVLANAEQPCYETVSCATGAGKTKAAEALIAHVAPEPVTFVIKEIREIDTVYRELVEVLPDFVSVAMWDSIHRRGASRSAVTDKEREMGRKIAAQFTAEEAAQADVLITTHDKWKSSVEGSGDVWVTSRNGQPKLVIVDEDPDLERTYLLQPENVSELMSVLSDVTLEEARSYGFCDHHAVVPTLEAVHQRMMAVKKPGARPTLSSTTDLVGPDDLRQVNTITDEELKTRLAVLEPDAFKRLARLERLRDTVRFLQAAAEGRVFYSQDGTPAFHAYALMVPPQPRTIVLDGTADINGLFSVSSHVHVIDTDVTPDYSALELNYVIPPAEFRGKLKPTKAFRARWTAQPLMEWFFQDLLLPNTEAGDKVLVYAKKRLLEFDLQREYDESHSPDPYKIEIEGRTIWFCHFGSGRGSNRWKECNVYFRVGEFYPKKAVTLSKACSIDGGRRLSDHELRDLSSGTTRHELYELARDTHLMVHNKQETARTCIRQLDDHGRCAPAKAFMVDSDLALLSKYLERMYPGAAPYRVVDFRQDTDTGQGTGPQRIMDYLLTTEALLVSFKELAEACGVAMPHVGRFLAKADTKAILGSRGWRYSTLKAETGGGRGKCLTRR